MIDLDELERLAAQATPGPWEVDDCNNIRIAPKGRPIVATIHDDEDYLPRMADAQYITAACNAVPELIARVRELERQREILAHRLADAAKIHVKAYSVETWIELAEIAAKEADE